MYVHKQYFHNSLKNKTKSSHKSECKHYKQRLERELRI